MGCVGVGLKGVEERGKKGGWAAPRTRLMVVGVGVKYLEARRARKGTTKVHRRRSKEARDEHWVRSVLFSFLFLNVHTHNNQTPTRPTTDDDSAMLMQHAHTPQVRWHGAPAPTRQSTCSLRAPVIACLGLALTLLRVHQSIRSSISRKLKSNGASTLDSLPVN